MEIVAGEQGLALQQLFRTNLRFLIFFKIQTVIKSHFFNASRSCDGLAAKGLLGVRTTNVVLTQY